MTNAGWRRVLALSFLVTAIAALGWVSPAAAGGRAYAEAPMQLMTKGLTAEQHLLRQAELGRRLARELPAAALGTIRIPLAAEEIRAVDQAPRSVAPLKIGLVKALIPGIVVAGLDREGLGWEPTADGGLVWAVAVRSEDAGAIRLHVENMLLPRNAELYVYGRGGLAYGPYTASGPNGTGDFWTTAVFGSEVILQLRLSGPVSEADLDGVSFQVAEAGLITRKFTVGLLDGAGSQGPQVKAPPPPGFPCGNPNCVVDATCILGTPADPAKLATAKMEWPQGAYIYTCTGGLIADNNPSQNNFFLTANHCLSSNKAAQNVSFYWRFATSTCNASTCPNNGGWPFVTTGARVSASGRKGDFTLLQLNSNPPAGSVFLGWTNAPVANTNGADLFRVSNPNFGPQVFSQHDVDTSVGTCTGWPRGERIYSRDMTGAIDGGSSGSPILNAAGQIVGQLTGTCGFNVNDPCAAGPGEANATVDGALAFYYSIVQPFLNP